MHSPEQKLGKKGLITEEFPPRTHSRNLLCYQEMIQIKPPVWLVENLIPDGSTAVLFGASNAFKSFIAVDIGCSIAVSVSYHGLKVKPGIVVFVASESAYGIAAKRIPAWMAHHDVPSPQRQGVYLRPVPPLLDDADSLKGFKADLASVEPSLVIYDVLAGTMKGSEKDTEVIARWVRVVGEIEEEFGCSQLFVTHSPYGDSDRIRGGTHLWGSFGTRLKAKGDSDRRTTVLSVERHKDHDSAGLWWGFRLKVTEIDEFPDQTSLVPVKDDDVDKSRTRTIKLTEPAQEALRSFKYAIAEHAGQKVGSAHIPFGVEVLTVNLWRLYFDKLTTFQGTAEARRKRFDRGISRLNEFKLVAKWDDQWWLTDAGKAVP